MRLVKTFSLYIAQHIFFSYFFVTLEKSQTFDLFAPSIIPYPVENKTN